MAITRIDPFDPAFIRGVCDVLAQTEAPGLTGSEIDGLLPLVNASPRNKALNKRDGLYTSLLQAQSGQGAGNAVSAFIVKAMSLGRYANTPQRFHELRAQLNEFMVFHGWSVEEGGQLGRTKAAATLSQGAEIAGTLLTELKRRGTHAELLSYCREELVSKSLFHAMSEASKSIPAKVRQLTGLIGDGAALYDGVFGTNRDRPLWSINCYLTDSETSEHRGFKNLIIGIHGHFRNPRAHASRIHSSEDLSDFYDAFALFSYVHRRIDGMRRLSSN